MYNVMDVPSKKSTIKKTTVDADYNKQVKSYLQDIKQIPAKKKKLKQLQNKYNSMRDRNMNQLSTEEINELHELKSEISRLSLEINDDENCENLTDFYLKTGELLIEYYDKEKVVHKQPSHVIDQKGCDILNFFGTKTNTETAKKSTTENKVDIYEQYLECTNNHYITSVEYSNEDQICQKCGVPRELLSSEAIMVCPKCGDELQTIMESEKPSYRDPPHDNLYFAYKRINHFKEQLAHYQAKETTKIPQEIYDIILVEFKKEGKTNLASLDKAKVKKYLQKYAHLGYNKYYENINQIICHLNGIQPFYMKPEIEEQLCNMFQKIQESFEKHRPPNRRNFLSYSYVIYKFCQILGYTEYLPYFSLLKSKDKLRQQDKIWKKICIDMKWPFYASSG